MAIPIEDEIYEKLSPAGKADYRRAAAAELAKAAADHEVVEQRATEFLSEQRTERVAVAAAAEQRNIATVEKIARQRHDSTWRNVVRHLDAASEQRTSDPNVRFAEEQKAISAFRRSHDWADLAKESRARLTVNEPDVYGPRSDNSYFRDLVNAVTGDPSTQSEAAERLTRYGRGLQWEVGAAGKHARRSWRNAARKDDDLRSASEAEYRAMSTSTAGAFTTPVYLGDSYAIWRSYVPSILDAANTSLDLPDFGMTVSIPADLAATAIDVQSYENSGVDQDTFGTQYLTANVVTYAGSVPASQQLLDRSGPTTKIDEVIYSQLRAKLDAQIDKAVATAMIAQATNPMTQSGYVDARNLWSPVNNAASSLETTDGTLLPATHCFMPPKNFRWFASQVDTSARPIWTPDGSSAPDPQTGFTGYRIASTAVYTDGSIPATSGNATMLVSNPASTVVLVGEPVPRVIQGQYASTLTTLVQLYCYVAIIVRYPSATVPISGAWLPLAPSFA